VASNLAHDGIRNRTSQAIRSPRLNHKNDFMSTSTNSLSFARVAATIAAAMFAAAIIAVAVLALIGAGPDGAQDASASEGVRIDGVAVAKPTTGLVDTIHPIVAGGLGHKEYQPDRDHDRKHRHDHDRRHAGNQRVEEIGAVKDSSRPPGVSQPVDGPVD
jgi:hypothetical protein